MTHDDDDDTHGPAEPEAMHWHWQQFLTYLVVLMVLCFVVASCSTTLDGRRIYPPAPHYQGYALEFEK